MSRIFFAEPLETVATYWRIMRRDGVTLGFTSHNRDLAFSGIIHMAAPGMVPSSIRRSADLASELVEMEGILSHGAITPADLRMGRYDEATIEVGVVDWESLEHAALFAGEVSSVTENGESFEASLQSAKTLFERDLVPRTSPTCRARFCDRDCGLNPARFTHLVRVTAINGETGSISFSGLPAPDMIVGGRLRWIDGPQAGVAMRIMAASGSELTLDRDLAAGLAARDRAEVLESCDHTIATCAARFGNAANFRGEPFMPGNDLLTRYGTGGA
ncbi:DUF2163 domain-containing protein [Aurantiacibacter flavus]|uniref:DUF2163 domain-containing protein n=1 Tax=Aurantiacibacter flavus TaxID=3145232 RepID=A0ABV0CXX0_9SPHN